MKILRIPAVFSSNFPFFEDLSNPYFFFDFFKKKFVSSIYTWAIAMLARLDWKKYAPNFRAVSGKFKKLENDA